MNGLLKKIRENITILTIIGAIIASAAATYVTATLSPYKQELAIISIKVEANEERDDTEHPKFVTREEIQTVLKSIDRRLAAIEGRLMR